MSSKEYFCAWCGGSYQVEDPDYDGLLCFECLKADHKLLEQRVERLRKESERLEEIIAWARSRKQHIENDERFHYKPARVQINAPLALIQVDLKAQHNCLSAVLRMAKGEE